MNFWHFFINISIPFGIVLPNIVPFFIINAVVYYEITKASTKLK